MENSILSPVVTLSLRCFQRPQRTRRMIENVLAQTFNGWELLLTGDNCPNFKDPDFIKFVKEAQVKALANGNRIIFSNNYENAGGCGYVIINQHINSARGKWFIFLSNDDMIMPEHVQNYVSFMEDEEDLDWAYFNSKVPAIEGGIRIAELRRGYIGHSELIINTRFLRKMPLHGPEYGHDWELVKNLINSTVFYAKAINRPATYIVKSLPGNIEPGID